MPSLVVRDATAADAAACAAVYAPYVTDTVASFEAEPPGAEQMAGRIAAAQAAHAWLVAELDGAVVGYAYGTSFNPREAYRWSCAVSVYLAPDRRRTGGGRALYTALLARLTDRGFRRALAGITQPNEASTAFHRAFGFRHAGRYERVGWKHGAWHDVVWLQRDLVPAGAVDDPPAPLR